MSTARYVPETRHLDAGDARDTLLRTGRRRLLVDSFVRLRASDGTSHARSIAFTGALVLVQGCIAAVGLAAGLLGGALPDSAVRVVHDTVPGPAGQLLTQAVTQADRVGSSGRFLPLVLGGIGAFVAAVTMMGQVERATNRIYGVEADRPTGRKYLRAAVLTVTAVPLAAFAFSSMALGTGVAQLLDDGPVGVAWRLLRWPVGLLVLTVATAIVVQYAPRRRQPGWSWLAYGCALAVLLSAAASGLLALFFRVSSSFGETYGPLAGMLAMLLWGNLVAFATLYGVAIAAQLEAVRAGVPEPRYESRQAGTVDSSPTRARVPLVDLADVPPIPAATATR